MVGPLRSVRALFVGGTAWFAVEAVALVAAVIGVLVDSPGLTLGSLLIGAGAGAAAPRVHGVPASTVGGLMRGLVALVAAAVAADDGAVAVVAGGIAVLTCGRLAVDVADARTQGLRRHPASRGIPGVGSVPLVSRPPTAPLAFLPEVLVLVPAVAVPERTALVVGGVVAAVLVTATVVTRWVAHLARARRPSRAVLTGMRGYLTGERPPVILYFGDGPQSLHELAVWLPTMERLSSPVVLLLRNRGGPRRAPADQPPRAVRPRRHGSLSLPLAEAQVALFVANIGNNIHVLRVPGLRSAFIGHGDSDKSASANPFSKVYDEIWVAGQAGKDRYLRAGVGIRPEALVEVGRPQVECIRRGPVEASVPTILYAPTWEGWNADQDYSSVATHGETLVRAVLASSQPVRLIYRPHPYTGRRSSAAASANRTIIALLREANDAAGHTAATVLARAPSSQAPVSAAEAETAVIAEGEERLRSLPAMSHVVVPPNCAPLVSCFNVAAGLVTDVSSVLTDFLVSDRPVGVCNPRGGDITEFRSGPPRRAAPWSCRLGRKRSIA